jgi:hypothetical protein
MGGIALAHLVNLPRLTPWLVNLEDCFFNAIG